MSREGTEREGERIPSKLHAVSTEPTPPPNTGLDLINSDIMTGAEIKSQTLNWLSHPGSPMQQTLIQKNSRDFGKTGPRNITGNSEFKKNIVKIYFLTFSVIKSLICSKASARISLAKEFKGKILKIQMCLKQYTC